MRVPTTLWYIRPELVRALDEALGPPIDSYLNGSQVWLTADAELDARLEWRLHPVGAYHPPAGLAAEELWDAVVQALDDRDATGDRMRLGEETRALASLWDGLECYLPDFDDVEPATLAGRATARLGIPPDRHGMVDHEAIADTWEHSRRTESIVRLLAEQLGT